MMSVYELRDLGLLISVSVLPSMILAWLLVKWRPRWSRRRIVVVAASPLPALALLLCAVIIVTAALSSKEACGVDACGMAMMAASVVAGYALVAFVLAMGAAWLFSGSRPE